MYTLLNNITKIIIFVYKPIMYYIIYISIIMYMCISNMIRIVNYNMMYMCISIAYAYTMIFMCIIC